VKHASIIFVYMWTISGKNSLLSVFSSKYKKSWRTCNRCYEWDELY